MLNDYLFLVITTELCLDELESNWSEFLVKVLSLMDSMMLLQSDISLDGVVSSELLF